MRDRRLQAERVADGEDELSDAQRVRVREPDVFEPGLARAHDGEVGALVRADDVGDGLAAVPVREPHRPRLAHDVGVREDVAVRCDDDAAPAAAIGPHVHDRGRDALRHLHEGVGELLEDRRCGLETRRPEGAHQFGRGPEARSSSRRRIVSFSSLTHSP